MPGECIQSASLDSIQNLLQQRRWAKLTNRDLPQKKLGLSVSNADYAAGARRVRWRGAYNIIGGFLHRLPTLDGRCSKQPRSSPGIEYLCQFPRG